MKLEELGVGDTVEAVCMKCNELHHWEITNHKLAPRVLMGTVGGGKQACGNNAQFTYPDKVDRIVEKAANE